MQPSDTNPNFIPTSPYYQQHPNHNHFNQNSQVIHISQCIPLTRTSHQVELQICYAGMRWMNAWTRWLNAWMQNRGKWMHECYKEINKLQVNPSILTPLAYHSQYRTHPLMPAKCLNSVYIRWCQRNVSILYTSADASAMSQFCIHPLIPAPCGDPKWTPLQPSYPPILIPKYILFPSSVHPSFSFSSSFHSSSSLIYHSRKDAEGPSTDH